MDVPPIADASPEPVFAPPGPPPSPPPGVEARLANVEAALAETNERLDALGVSLEASLREAVTQEVQVVSGELRHTVAELGRLLVRDIGKLPKLLSEHRDAIVAELAGRTRSAPAVTAAVPPTPPTATAGGDDTSSPGAGGFFDDEALSSEAVSSEAVSSEALSSEALSSEAEAEADADAGGVGDGAEARERQRRSLIRRRHG